MSDSQFSFHFGGSAIPHSFAASRALIVRAPWAGLILSGVKTWEIRGMSTNVRGRIGIIQGGSKCVFGYCDLVQVHGPLSLEQMLSTIEKHQMSEDELRKGGLPYRQTYAWEMRNPLRLDEPKPYIHRSGAIIWALLDVERDNLRVVDQTENQSNKETNDIPSATYA